MIKGAPTCRVVYPRGLFEKTQVKGGVGEPKYNAIILIPKDDAEKVAQVNEFYMKAFKQLQDTGFKSKTPKGINPKTTVCRTATSTPTRRKAWTRSAATSC